MLFTTYNLAKKHNACERAMDAWEKHVGKVDGDALISLTDVLDVLGIDDCLWAFRAVQDEEVADIIILKFLTAITDKWLIYFESKYPEDKRPCQVIEALQAYFLKPSVKTAYAVDAAYAVARGANLSADDRDILWLLAGGVWYHGAHCGSRCRFAVNARWYTFSNFGGRALSEAERKWQIAKLKELLNEV